MVFIPFPAGTQTPPLSPLPEEMAVNRDLTWWFIEQDPVDVVLKTRVKVRTPSGAYRSEDGPDRPLQRFKFIYGGSTGAGRAGIVETGDGRERMFSYIMVGRHNAEVAPGDYWTDTQGQHWEVEELLPYNGYEVKATIRSYGENPQNG